MTRYKSVTIPKLRFEKDFSVRGRISIAAQSYKTFFWLSMATTCTPNSTRYLPFFNLKRCQIVCGFLRHQIFCHIIPVSFLPLFYPHIRYSGLFQYRHSPPSGTAFRHHLYPRRPLVPKPSECTKDQDWPVVSTTPIIKRHRLEDSKFYLHS